MADIGARARAEFDPTQVLDAHGLLREFNRAGVLSAADVHVASTLGRLAGESDEMVLLAAALAVRGTRAGSVVLDLVGVAQSVAPDELDETGLAADPAATIVTGDLPWPEVGKWIEACSASPLVCLASDETAT